VLLKTGIDSLVIGQFLKKMASECVLCDSVDLWPHNKNGPSNSICTQHTVCHLVCHVNGTSWDNKEDL